MGNEKADNGINNKSQWETWIEWINKFPMCDKKCTQCYSNGLYIKGFFLYHIEDFTDSQLNFLIDEINKFINRRKGYVRHETNKS